MFTRPVMQPSPHLWGTVVLYVEGLLDRETQVAMEAGTDRAQASNVGEWSLVRRQDRGLGVIISENRQRLLTFPAECAPAPSSHSHAGALPTATDPRCSEEFFSDTARGQWFS
jgi:hypothetical protein